MTNIDFSLESNDFQKQVTKEFSAFKIPKQNLENGCILKNSKFQLGLHQQFISQYFTPLNPNGLFIFHGIGSGKTLTGVNLVSHFQKQNFNVLWVTRRTLVKDITKAVDMLKTQPFIKLSYKQFSNVCKRKGTLYESIIKRNNKLDKKNEKLSSKKSSPDDFSDPLRNTLVIIDEAHKLYGNDLKSQEKHDIKAIEKAINESYRYKENRCRLVLMSATPISDDPIELIKTLNLLITNPKERFNISTFYDGYISNEGNLKEPSKFNEKTKGLVSYLDVSTNHNVFAKTNNVNVTVPLSERVTQKSNCKNLRILCKAVSGVSNKACDDAYEICKKEHLKDQKEYKKLVFQKEKLDECFTKK